MKIQFNPQNPMIFSSTLVTLVLLHPTHHRQSIPQVIGPRARSLGTGTPRLPFKASDKAESESPARKQHHGLCCRERLMFFFLQG